MKYVLVSIVLMSTLIISPEISYSQSPAEYICNAFDGTLTQMSGGRSFSGTPYKCTVEEQWDMQIQSKLNELILEDDHFSSAQDWSETYVDNANYNRRAFGFRGDQLYIVNFYVLYGEKTDHFIVAYP